MSRQPKKKSTAISRERRAQRGRRPEKMREDMLRDGSLAQFALQVREEKCIGKLLETAKMTEVDPSVLEETAKRNPKKQQQKRRKNLQRKLPKVMKNRPQKNRYERKKVKSKSNVQDLGLKKH